MKKAILIIMLLVALPFSVLANCNYNPLNTISYNVSTQKWLSAKDAKVTVVVNATLASAAVSEFSQELVANLSAYAKGWHIIAFSQVKNESGLQNVKALAQVRVPNGNVAAISVGMKKLTKQGVSYKIANLEFTPSFAQKQHAYAAMRIQLFNEIHHQLLALNKIYQQKFYINNIDFQTRFVASNTIRPVMFTAGVENAMRKSTRSYSAKSSNMAISQKLVLSANVKFGNVHKLPCKMNRKNGKAVRS